MSIVAATSDVKFSGNTAGGVSNAIYQDSTDANDNVISLISQGGQIIFDDAIAGGGTGTGKNIININKDVTDTNVITSSSEIISAQNGKTYVFNNEVSGNNINIGKAGIIKMGKSGSNTGVLKLGSNVFKTEGSGNTLDLQNGYLDNGSLKQDIGVVDLTSANLNAKIDIKVGTKEGDMIKLDGSSYPTTNTVHLTAVNILDSMDDFSNPTVLPGKGTIQILDNVDTTDIIKLSVADDLKNTGIKSQ